MYRLSQIAEITGAVVAGTADHRINAFMHDSRSVQATQGTLFVALRSSRNNAHRFIADLVKRGFKSFLVEKGQIDTGAFTGDVSFVVCDDPLEALQKLAAFHRLQFYIPVIAITGSNGKTVVKEWLYQLLKGRYSICRSPKSYNSQIGVPLSVLNMRAFHTLAIFEAGISMPGEMEKLEKIIRPTIGVFTSIGSAHDEGFSGHAEKLKEKLMLFQHTKTNIFHMQPLAEGVPGEATNIFIGGSGADWEFSSEGQRVQLRSGNEQLLFSLPFGDEASLRNGATCAIVLKTLGFGDREIAEGIARLQPVALRLEIKNGIHRSLLINDFYNSDLDSLQIALDHLKKQDRHRKKIVVVSDIEQSGLDEKELYTRMSRLLSAHRPDLVIGIGEKMKAHEGVFGGSIMFFRDTLQFISQLPSLEPSLAGAAILLKGARSFGFETISRRLQQKSHDTVFEIDLNRLMSNVNYYRSLIKPRVQMMCMVKAMGYGSGGPEIARSLQHIGVNYLAVAYADEGVELREADITLPVMVMNPEPEGFEDMIRHQLEPEIYSFRILEAFAASLDSAGVAEPFPVHIKIDTGMHRLGFEEEEVDTLLEKLREFPQLKIQSVFSHLAGSEDPAHDPFTLQQMQVFAAACDRIEARLGYRVIRHICNSAGITRFPEAHLDMVRLGIGMYGVGSSPLEQSQLSTVGTLKTAISQIRTLQAGDTVGYGRMGQVKDPLTIAVIPIGYADGFLRMLGNGTHGVYIKGQFCRTVGNICMDMCMVDITGLACSEGDEVVVFNSFEQLQSLARAMHTISYEVLTNVSARVKRIYIQE